MSKLQKEIIKLARYITRHSSRQLKVEQALGAPGCKMLQTIIDLATEEAEEDEAH